LKLKYSNEAIQEAISIRIVSIFIINGGI